MFKIFNNRNILKNIYLRSIRKYSENQGPFYDCPHQQEKIMEARRREKEKKVIHPFLVEKDHSKKVLFYQRLFCFVCVPSMIISFIYAWYIVPEPKRPPFIPYSYMYRRVRDFPWKDGKKTLFHNPRMNALPDGYESDEEEDD